MSDSVVYEKRSSPRFPIEENLKVGIEVTLPFPKGYKIKRALMDISNSGFSFKMLSDEGYLIKGTPLNEIELIHNDKSFKLSGEVVYVARLPFENGLDYKIGVQVSKRLHFINNSFLKTQYRLRPKRYQLGFIANLEGLITCTNKNIVLTGKIINISKFGAAFKFKSDFIIKSSQSFRNVKIIIRGEIIFSGGATVINVREDNGETIVGISFQDSFVDIESLSHLTKLERITENCKNFVQSLSFVRDLDEKFKTEVMEMRFYLDQIEQYLHKQDALIRKLDFENQKLVQEYILDTLQEDFRCTLDRLCTNIYVTVKENSLHRHALNKKFFQMNLHPYLMQSAYVERIYRKPLGYAGDFEVINMTAKGGYQGQNIFSKLINSYMISVPPAIAVRNRLKFLESEISQTSDLHKDSLSQVRVTSIGCGPAIEIQNLVQNKKIDKRFEINLLDFDEVVLSYVEEKLYDLKLENKNDVKIRLFHSSIREILRTEKLPEGIEGQDLIYCTGVFDYLSDSACSKIIEVLAKHLKSNGKLIIGNFSHENLFRYVMEYCGEWYLNYRTENDLLRILPENIPTKNVSFSRDETCIQVFLIVLMQGIKHNDE